MKTTYQIDISSVMVDNYLFAAVNKVYKILPLKEHGEETLGKYIHSLVREMLGCHEMIEVFQNDSRYLDVVGALHYMSGHIEEMELEDVKSDVFRCINLIKNLRRQYISAR